jgi:hypothetical protein
MKHLHENGRSFLVDPLFDVVSQYASSDLIFRFIHCFRCTLYIAYLSYSLKNMEYVSLFIVVHHLYSESNLEYACFVNSHAWHGPGSRASSRRRNPSRGHARAGSGVVGVARMLGERNGQGDPANRRNLARRGESYGGPGLGHPSIY